MGLLEDLLADIVRYRAAMMSRPCSRDQEFPAGRFRQRRPAGVIGMALIWLASSPVLAGRR